jgi:hypothetical protein
MSPASNRYWIDPLPSRSIGVTSQEIIAPVMSIFLLVLGSSYLLQQRHWSRLFREASRQPAHFLPFALMMLTAGLAVALGFNDWSGTWPVFITAFGWLMALEGAMILVNPGWLGWFRGISDRFLSLYFRLGGVLLIVLGGLLARHYLLSF